MTRESLADPTAFSRANKSCATKIITSTASKQQLHMECDQGGMKMTGDMTIDRIDSEHIKGNMVMKAVGAPQPVETKVSIDTKWISANCGDVKPPSLK